jgi:hypothetical protein
MTFGITRTRRAILVVLTALCLSAAAPVAHAAKPRSCHRGNEPLNHCR